MSVAAFRNPYTAAGFGIIAVFFVWGVLTLGFYPPVEYNLGDEIWSVESSLGHIESPNNKIITPRLYFVLLGYYLKAFGAGVFGARLLSLAFACGALFFVRLAARETGGEKAGLAALVIAASSYAFGWHARVARPEMLSALIISASFWLALSGVSRASWARVFLSGLLAALSVHAHANCVVYVPAIVAACLSVSGGMGRRMRILPLLSGICAGAFIWYIWAYAPSAGGGAALTNAVAVVANNIPIAKGSALKAALRGFIELPKDYLVEYPRLFNGFFTSFIDMFYLEYAALCILTAGLFSPAGRKAVPGLVFCLASAYFGYLLSPRFGYWHVIELYPILAVSGAHAVFGIGEILGKYRRPLLAKAVPLSFIIVFAGLGIADTASSQWRFSSYGYYETLESVSASVPKGAKTAGRNFYAPAFEEGGFQPIWFGIDKPGGGCGDFETEARARGVEYIIVDPALLRFASIACGAGYREGMLRFLNLECAESAKIEKGFPSYWGKGEIISGILICHMN